MFADEMNKMADVKSTENGGYAYSSTGGGALIDFFSIIGAMRKRDEKDILEMYYAARREDKELADKVILYVSNIREGGLGERRIGRILLRALAFLDHHKVERNFQTFVNNSRFDCLYVLEGTPAETAMWNYMKETFLNDLKAMKEGKPISLAAKWMKSINTSSKESKRIARKFCTIAGVTERTYRKTLAALRKYSNIVEVKMSANEWDTINFEAVPSVAMKRYAKAFDRHCPNAFTKFKADVESGDAKINSSTLYPYDITYSFIYGGNADKEILEAQWKNQKNYFKENSNVIVAADVSSSMSGMPMAASIGLALYAATFNQGPYHGSYLTFTDEPHFYRLDETQSLEWNIAQCMRNVGYNTEMDKMFKAIYETAVKANDAPDALVIVSDMEIDRFMRPNACDDIITKWVNKFREAGLECPKMILWNAECRQNTYLARSNNPYVAFVSGVSAGTFANLAELISCTPYEAMVKILNQYKFV